MFETTIGRIITHAGALVIGAFLCVVAVHNDLSGDFWIILATCIIAMFTVITVLVQAGSAALHKKYAEASWQRELHADRINILSKFEHLSTVVQTQTGETVWDAIRQADNAARRVDFYFQTETASYLKDVAEKASLYVQKQHTFDAKVRNPNIHQTEIDALNNDLLEVSNWLNANANSTEIVKRLSNHLLLPNKL